MKLGGAVKMEQSWAELNRGVAGANMLEKHYKYV